MNAILEKIDALNDETWRDGSNLDECIAILRRGLEEFPGNESDPRWAEWVRKTQE